VLSEETEELHGYHAGGGGRASMGWYVMGR
jgi:hypothetical protein